MTVEEIKKELQALGDPSKIADLERYAIQTHKAFGIRTPELKTFAREVKKLVADRHATALKLWKTGIYDARAIAFMIDDNKKVTREQMDDWAADFDNWATVDGACSYLFCRTPFAYEKAFEWVKREPEFEKRAGFSMYAHLLVLNGQAKEALPLMNKINDEKDRLFLMTVISFALNQKTKADEYFNKFRNKYSTANPQNVSEILVIYGQKEEALKTLEKVVKPTVLNFPSVDKWFDSGLFIMASPYLIPLRDDPKFKEICKKLNYPEIK